MLPYRLVFPAWNHPQRAPPDRSTRAARAWSLSAVDADRWISIAAMAAAAVLLFIVAAAEAAIIYISRSRARPYIRGADERSEALHRYIAERQRTLSALNLGRTLAVVTGAAAAMHWASSENALTWQQAALTAGATLVVAGVIDGIPDVVVSRNPEFWAQVLTPPIRLLGLFFWPLAWLLDLPGRLIARLPLAPPPTPADGDQEELLRLVEMEKSGGGIEEEEREMIRGVIGLVDTTAREIMVPRIDIAAVPADATIDDVLDVVVQKGYSRVPIYEEHIDNIVGIVYAKDVLRHMRNGAAPPSLREIARPPYFIPETKKVDELLHELRSRKIHIAVVVDEYGGTAGLVTTEDILEEIVGEIEDEYDTAPPQIERISEHEAIIDARLSIDDLNDLFHAGIEDEDVDTIGGFVFNQLGKMPSPGDEVHVDGIVIHVLDVQGNRIRKVHVERVESAPVSNGT
jgi:putative hemolysin